MEKNELTNQSIDLSIDFFLKGGGKQDGHLHVYIMFSLSLSSFKSNIGHDNFSVKQTGTTSKQTSKQTLTPKTP